MLKNTPFNTTRESTFSRIGITISILLISFFYMNTKGYTQSDDHIKYWAKITDYQSKRREYIFKNRKQGFTNIYINYF